MTIPWVIPTAHEDLSVFGPLRLRPRNVGAAVRAGVCAVLGVVAFVLLLEAIVFRSVLPANYVAVFTGPNLAARIAVVMVKTVGEELTYRLGLMSLIVFAGLWLSQGRHRTWIICAAIVAAQAANVLPKFPPPHGAAEMVYDVLRFGVTGLVWGWLYWRHGFVTSLIAHPLVHLLLQPALLFAL